MHQAEIFLKMFFSLTIIYIYQDIVCKTSDGNKQIY